MAKLIAHWSPNHGIGTTATSIAISTHIAMNYKLKNLLTHCQYHKSNMESAFFSENVNESLLKFNDTGVDALVRLAKSGQLSNLDKFDPYVKKLIDERLYFLMGSKKIYNSIFINNAEAVILKILDSAKKHFNIVNVDTNSGYFNEVSKKVLKDADIVVVNLSQNEKLLTDLFIHKLDYEAIKDKKVIYVLSKYDVNSMWDVKFIKNNFNIKENIFCLPYLTEYSDACNNHAALKFLSSNKRTEELEVFNEQLNEISNEILLKLGFNVDELKIEKKNVSLFSKIFNSKKQQIGG
jgi:hypothetical protein